MVPKMDKKNNRTFEFSPGIEINFEVCGNGNQPMLLLHGFGASLESWRDIQPWLEKHFRLYLVDLKGFGLSSKPKGGLYSLEDQVDVVVSFIESLNFDRLILIGHSYGGAIALLTYFKLDERSCAERISSLVLIDAAGYLQKLPFFISILQTPLVNRIVLNCLPAKWRAKFTLRRVFHDPCKVTDQIVDRYARFLDLPGSHNALIETAKLVIPDDPASVIQRIREIRAQTLIIWGQNDPAIPLEHAYRFREDISTSTLEVIPECGHIPHEEKPSETGQVVLSFLE